MLAAPGYVVYDLNQVNMPGTNWTWWFAWYDQSEYLKAATDLASLKLRPSVYPLGYPLLGALFLPVLPRHRFFFRNLAFAVAISVLFYLSVRTLVSRWEAAALTLAGVMAISQFWRNTLIVPWYRMDYRADHPGRRLPQS